MGDLVPDEDDEQETPRKDAKSSELAYGGPPRVDDDDETKAQYVLARYNVQDDYYRGLHAQWVKVIYFLVGKQWLKYDETSGGYQVDTDVPEWRQQPVTNWTWAVYRTLIAKLTKQRPRLEVVPPSGDTEDRESAKLGESILQHLEILLKSPQKAKRAIGWLLATGNVHFDEGWDANEGEARPRTVLVEVPNPDNPGDPTDTVNADCPCDENGEPYMTPEGEYDLQREPDMVPIGEITHTVVDPLSLRWDPEATDEHDATECYRARMVPAETLAEMYGISVDELTKASHGTGDHLEDVETAMESVASGTPDAWDAKWTSIGTTRRGNTSNRVLELRYYAKPNAARGYPHGRHWIVAGGKKVWPAPDDEEFPNGEAPLPNGFWPPVVPLLDTTIPGQAHAQAVLSQVVPLNEKFNVLDAGIGEYHDMMALGGCIFVHPDDKNIKITTEPGQVRVSKGMLHGHAPIREKLEALPGQVYSERDGVASNIRAISGTSQLDLGERPEGVTAGRAFLVIQEASDAAIATTLEAVEIAHQECGRRWLVLAQRYYDEERTIKIRGERGQWEYRSFSNADLREGMDVRVVTGSAFPFSKSAQFDMRISLIEALGPLGILNGANGQYDPTKLAKMLEPGSVGMSAFIEDGDADLDEISREHAMFAAYDPSDPTKSNMLPQLAFWQNHQKHQEGHFEWMKRNYARYQQWSKPAQLAFIEHMRLTVETVAQQISNIAAAQAGVAPPGAAGGGGGAPPPQPGGPGPNAEADPTPKGLRLTRGDRASAGQAA